MTTLIELEKNIRSIYRLHGGMADFYFSEVTQAKHINNFGNSVTMPEIQATIKKIMDLLKEAINGDYNRIRKSY